MSDPVVDSAAAKVRLLSFFRPVYRYTVIGEKPEGGDLLDPVLWGQSEIVYVRLFDNEPVYVGSTDKKLSRRIGAHLRLIPTPINKTYREWAQGKAITILGYKPDPIDLMGYKVSAHRLVEALLIEKFRPAAGSLKPWFVKRT